MDILPSVLAHPLPLAVRLVAMAISSRPPLAAIASSVLLSSFSASIDPFALMSPCSSGPSPAVLAVLRAFPMRPGLPVLRLPRPAAATPGVVVAPGRPLVRARPGNHRGIQADVRGVVVVLALAAPPALRGLAPLQGGPDRTRASSTAASTMLVEACLSVELIGGVVLAEAEVRIVCGGLVGVVIAVLMGVHHQWSVQVGLHVWTDVT